MYLCISGDLQRTLTSCQLKGNIRIPELPDIENTLKHHHIVLITGICPNLIVHAAIMTIKTMNYDLENSYEVCNKKDFDSMERECQTYGHKIDAVLCKYPFGRNNNERDFVRSLQRFVVEEGEGKDVIIVSEQKDLQDSYGLDKYLVRVKVENFISVESPEPNSNGNHHY